MSTYIFGAGSMYGIQNGVPIKFGGLQEGTIELSSTQQELYGQFQYPLTVARGQSKIAGTSKMASINAKAFNAIYFGGTLTTGQKAFVVAEPGTVPASSPFTVSVANAATFSQDLGVVYTSGDNAGVPLVQVASAPVTGEYSVAAGVYTFAPADTGLGVAIDYEYTLTTGQTITVVNPLMGVAPTFVCVFTMKYNGRMVTLKLFACTSTKLSLATKLSDFMIPEMDFSGYADAGGNVIELTSPE